MPGSSILNHRQHVGLQKLSALAGVTNSFLGPNKNYKFILDETTGESTLISSCFRVLESLELTCSVGQLAYETIEAHHRIYKTGSGCLLFMTGAWSRTALECLRLGIPLVHIISAMSEGMDICLNVCKQYSIPTKDIFSSQKPIAKNMTNNQPSVITGKSQRKLKLSRHFREQEFENPRLDDIAKRMSHGCSDAMDLVVKASHIQSNQGLPYDVTKISTCLLPGLPEDHACVLPGCTVLVSLERALVGHHLQGQDLKVALIDGDLTFTYRHLGFKKTRLQRVTDLPSSENQDEDWLRQVVRLLLNLDVKVLLISGVASGKLMDHCWRHNILVVEKTRLSVLKPFAATTGAVVLSYATQLNSKCIGAGVTVNVWKSLENEQKCDTVLNICPGKNNGLVTAVLTSCVQGKLQSLEDEFWDCAYRLHWALKDEALLLGAGSTEMVCIQRLQQQAQLNPRTADVPYTGVVLQLMADGLIDYKRTIMVNSGEHSEIEARTVVNQQLHGNDGGVNRPNNMFSKGGIEDSGETIYENVTVKQEAWRKALDLVFLVLQTDVEIITGVAQGSVAGQGGLMFL